MYKKRILLCIALVAICIFVYPGCIRSPLDLTIDDRIWEFIQMTIMTNQIYMAWRNAAGEDCSNDNLDRGKWWSRFGAVHIQRNPSELTKSLQTFYSNQWKKEMAGSMVKRGGPAMIFWTFDKWRHQDSEHLRPLVLMSIWWFLEIGIPPNHPIKWDFPWNKPTHFDTPIHGNPHLTWVAQPLFCSQPKHDFRP